MREVRQHRRVEGPVIVEYHLTDGSGMSGCSPATNVSEGGIRFPMEREVPVATSVELHLHVGRLGASPAVVHGHVVWVRPRAEGGAKPYDVGVSFSEPSARFMQRLLQRVYVYWQQLLRQESS